MKESLFVPLNDVRDMKRQNSVGSGSDCAIEDSGEVNTTDYRLQGVDATGSRKISLWHDVSLVHLEPETRKETEYYNFVCEIPKFSRYVTLTYTYYSKSST
jgi:inorganic pyrophosphatase